MRWRRGSVRFVVVGAASVIAELSFDCRCQRSASVRFLVSLRTPRAPAVSAIARTLAKSLSRVQPQLLAPGDERRTKPQPDADVLG